MLPVALFRLRQKAMKKRLIIYLPLVVATVLVAFCWLECAYRLQLYEQYGRVPRMNHVDEDYFSAMYSTAKAAIALSITGLFITLFSKRIPLAVLCLFLMVASVSFIQTLRSMHRNEVLVTYDEYAERWGA